jgi:methylthioribose-1-phosphate isomerase
MSVKTIYWEKGTIKLIDQTLLPVQFKVISCSNLETLWEAIKNLRVRGAPAIGVAAAFGVLLASEKFKGNNFKAFLQNLKKASDYIATSRPTAVNLFNCLNRMSAVIEKYKGSDVQTLKKLLKQEALKIFEEDRTDCRSMGNFGASLIKNKGTYLTVCNAGALATVDFGTALGVFYAAKNKGKKFSVVACETRPLLQGARLTTWELLKQKINTTLICDNMAATVMKQGKIDAIFAGADRIASNGDAANKIGTYSLAVLAKHHSIPFYIVAPFSTFDMKARDERDIPIEERHKDEVIRFRGIQTAPLNVNVFNPAFDVTPHQLITAIVTEKGIIKPPFKTNIQKLFC